MTFVPGGVPGAPRDAEVMKEYGAAKQQRLQMEAESRAQARSARPSWLQRWRQRHSK